MTREEAIKIIEEFGKAGGNIFIDGIKGTMSDKDLITLAENCQLLMQKNAQGKVENDV